MREDEAVLEKLDNELTETGTIDIYPSEKKTSANEYDWRWKSKDSWEWHAIINNSHVHLLISSVDDEWPWLILEKGNGDALRAAKITSCEYGLVVEISSSGNKAARICKEENGTVPLALTTESLMVDIQQIYDDEVFSAEQSIFMCFKWLNEGLLSEGLILKSIKV